MKYILIYNVLDERSFDFFMDLFKISFGLIFIFIPFYSSMKERYSKKKFIKLYLYLIIFFMIIDLLNSINISKTIANKDYLEIEGKIYDYKTTSNNYESFYINGHKFQSSSRYGFKYKYNGKKVIFKNGDKVKIYYRNKDNILQLWIEDKVITKKKRSNVNTTTEAIQ